MRIIGGKARGTKLYTLDGIETRPTLDRVKESLFNILQNDISESIVLDLFSGSGAIGLEFMSRGAKKAYLCDASWKAINIIKQNAEKTHLQDQVEILNSDFKEALLNLKDVKFDLIYIDPPYKTTFIMEALEIILDIECFKKDTIIILETDEKERIENEIQKLKSIDVIDERKYGRANLIFLRIIK